MNNFECFTTGVVGHQWAIDLLNRQQKLGQMPQALLLTGPPNVGKGTLGHFLAQSLNCRGESKPCGRCLSCHKIISGNHPDVRIFDDDNEVIKIGQIRALQRELSLSPHESQYRVALLCNFARATTSAANALLKTLEEPNEQVVIILTATDPSRLLPTIVSRCQMLTLRLLPRQEILEALQTRWQASPEQAKLLAQLAAGRLGWAVKALTDKNFLERRARYLHELLDLLRMSRAERLAYAQSLSRDPGRIKEILALWLTLWRDLLLLKSGNQTNIVNLDWQENLQTIARKLNLFQAKETVARLRAALINLERNVNPRLNLEVVLLKLPNIHKG
jgi:DNA polymerase-3 subunit delta'